MNEQRLNDELALLRSVYPDLEHRLEAGVNWERVPSYPVPHGWSSRVVEVAFQIPNQPGQAPYAFWTRPALLLASGAAPSNYAANVATPWGSGFSQFSWAPTNPWLPAEDIRAGANMLNFVRSFADRLREFS